MDADHSDTVIGGKTISNEKNSYYISPHNMASPIGKGRFGVIYRGIDSQNKVIAVKEIIKAKNQGYEEETKLLVESQKFQDTANIVIPIDYVDDDQSFYIVMQYFDSGNLQKFIRSHLITSELDAIEIFRQICFGTKVLHDKDIVHRDLKSENVLINTYDDPGYPIKYFFAVGNFGVAKEQYVGTPLTKAPEVDKGEYDQKADIYSLGCILFEMVIGKGPFEDKSFAQIALTKKSAALEVKSNFSTPLSKFTLGILEGCLQYDPINRLSAGELYKMLSIDTLYTLYSPLTLGEADPIQAINLKQYSRKGVIVEPLKEAPDSKIEILSDKIDAITIPKEDHKSGVINSGKEISIYSYRDHLKEIRRHLTYSKSNSVSIVGNVAFGSSIQMPKMQQISAEIAHYKEMKSSIDLSQLPKSIEGIVMKNMKSNYDGIILDTKNKLYSVLSKTLEGMIDSVEVFSQNSSIIKLPIINCTNNFDILVYANLLIWIVRKYGLQNMYKIVSELLPSSSIDIETVKVLEDPYIQSINCVVILISKMHMKLKKQGEFNQLDLFSSLQLMGIVHKHNELIHEQSYNEYETPQFFDIFSDIEDALVTALFAKQAFFEGKSNSIKLNYFS